MTVNLKRREWIDDCNFCFKRKTVFIDSGKCLTCEAWK